MKWTIYTLWTVSSTENLIGVMLRGRIRKFGIENNIDILAENGEDNKECVRIALLTESANSTLPLVKEYLLKIIPSIKVTQEITGIPNPILSKLKCNDESRYEL